MDEICVGSETRALRIEYFHAHRRQTLAVQIPLCLLHIRCVRSSRHRALGLHFDTTQINDRKICALVPKSSDFRYAIVENAAKA